MINIKITYFAKLREDIGINEENITTDLTTPRDIFFLIKNKYKLNFEPENLRVALNDEFVSWETNLKSNDQIVFIPPVAGG